VRLSRFLLASGVAAAVILSAPFIGDTRRWIRVTFPGHFTMIVASAIGLAVAAAIVVALVRIRERRAMRYGAIAAAIALAVASARWNAQGIPEVDVVERFHFVEYGLITFLFYRAWRPMNDGAMFVLPVLAGLLVGTVEEWLQWFIPARIGDMRDVFLNGAAIVSGLLFSIGLEPPPRLSLALRPGSLRRIGLWAVVTTLVFGLFVHSVHLGVENSDPEAGTFRSRYDTAALQTLSQDRLVRWKVAPPLRPHSISREDQYLSEGHLHVQERDRRWSTDLRTAWLENLILEKYYARVLDAPCIISKTGHRWPAEQRADAEQRSAAARAAATTPYASLADAGEGRHFIRTWSPLAVWGIVMAVAAALLVVSFTADRGGVRPEAAHTAAPPSRRH
jgi:hypothetical protein